MRGVTESDDQSHGLDTCEASAQRASLTEEATPWLLRADRVARQAARPLMAKKKTKKSKKRKTKRRGNRWGY